LLALNTHEYIKAVDYLNEAIRLAPNEPPYRYLLADAYIKIRRYETALSTMDHVAVKDAPFYEKLAECHAAAGQTGAAVKAMHKALFMNGAGAGLWVKLAAYHRLDYDLTQAEGAVTRALLIDPENERAKLENARIKKSLGRTREYQAILHDLLACLRKKYREALP
jgi:tetratricopeptide (TPR) repeat protein